LPLSFLQSIRPIYIKMVSAMEHNPNRDLVNKMFINGLDRDRNAKAGIHEVI